MADLRRRVAEKKARGLYTVDALVVEATEGIEPYGQAELERLRALAVQRLDLTTSASTKPVVGGFVTRLKRMLVRGTSQPLHHVIGQTNAYNGALLGYLSQIAREVANLQRHVEATQAITGQVQRSMAESELERQRDEGQIAGRAEELADEIAALAGRLGAAEVELGEWRRQTVPERLSRLEHGASGAADKAPSPGPALQVDGLGVARLRLAAFADREHEAGARWAAYAAALGDEGRVLHLGAGTGTSLAALGPAAEGVEPDGELAAAAEREGRRVHHADPTAYLARLEPGSVHGVLVTDLVERLDGAGLAALATAIAHGLAPGGRVVVEGLNPAALWALGDEVWRDPLRLRPVHPEAVRLVLEAAGLVKTQVELLDSPAEVDRLVPPPPSADPQAETLRIALDRLNDVLFGPRRYAVHGAR
jgi:hypothetical protein